MGAVVDTSLLKLLTATGCIKLLRKHFPLLITHAYEREHRSLQWPQANRALDEAIAAGQVQVSNPGVAAATDRLMADEPGLSYPDAEGIAWALRDNHYLLTEEQLMVEVMEHRGGEAVDLCDLLLAIKDEGAQNEEKLKALVYTIDLDLNHGISADCKQRLGVE